MAVFGEETVELPIFNGVAPSIYSTRVDKCLQLINLMKTGPSEFTVREDFVLINTGQKNATFIPLTQPLPMSLAQNDWEVFAVIGDPAVNSPTLILSDILASAPRLIWTNCNSLIPSVITQNVPVNRQCKAFVQFRDRYYASNGINQVFRVSNFTTAGATPVTITDLSAVGLDMLLSFRNRIFGFKKGRIYWTDLPAIGLYPETWNLAVNFVDMPAVDFDITIMNWKIYKDKIYLFTNRGIYYFQVNGDPLNWNIQLVSSSFPVYCRDAVCVNKNLVFLTDNNSVFQFDGSKFTRISDDIKDLFYSSIAEYSLFKVYPYEQGVLLTRIDYNDDGTNYMRANADGVSYYYDLDIWTGILPPIAGSDHIIKAGTQLVPYRCKPASSYIVANDGGLLQFQNAFLLDSGQWKGDCVSLNHASARGVTNVFITGPFVFSNRKEFLRVKKYIIHAILNVPPALLNTGSVSSDTLNGNYQTYSSLEIPTVSRYPQRYVVPANPTTAEFVSALTSFYMYIQQGAPCSLGAVLTTPPVVITKIEAVINTDNRMVTEPRNV